jgi:hypothetical protein
LDTGSRRNATMGKWGRRFVAKAVEGSRCV